MEVFPTTNLLAAKTVQKLNARLWNGLLQAIFLFVLIQKTAKFRASIKSDCSMICVVLILTVMILTPSSKFSQKEIISTLLFQKLLKAVFRLKIFLKTSGIMISLHMSERSLERSSLSIVSIALPF